MKIFLDTAEIDQIEQAAASGILDGVTTNPSLLSKTSVPFKTTIKKICSLVSGPVSVEVTASDVEEMLLQAREYAEIAENVVIKVPINLNGLKVVKQLNNEGIKTNVTLIFSPAQALLAAKAGASFVSPFVGRLDDISQDGMFLVEEIVHIFNNYQIPTEVIVASVRHPLHFVQAAKIGADIVTIPFSTFQILLNHPLTDIGIARFLADWKKVRQA